MSSSGARGQGHVFGGDSDEKIRFRKNSNRKLWKWLFAYLNQHEGKFKLYVFLLMLFTAISAYLPTISQMIIDDGITAIGDSEELWSRTLELMAIYSLLLFITLIGTAYIDYQMGKMGTDIVANIRQDLFDNIQNMSMDYFHKNKTGDIISKSTNDVDQLNMIFAGQLAMMIAQILRLFLVIIFMFAINWRLTLISMLMFPVMMFFSRILKTKVQKAFMETRTQISNLTQITEQNISGIKVIQGFGKQKEAEQKYQESNWKNKQSFLKAQKIMAFFIPLIMMVANIFLLLLLGIGALSIKGEIPLFKDQITIGQLSAFSTYLTQMIFPIIMFTMFIQMAESALASADRIYEVLYEKNSILEPKNPVGIKDIEGDITFENVTFMYPDREISEKEKHRIYTEKEGKKQMKSLIRKIPPHLRIKTRESIKNMKSNQSELYSFFLTMDPKIKMKILKIDANERTKILEYYKNLDENTRKEVLEKIPQVINQLLFQKGNENVRKLTIEEILDNLEKMRIFFNKPESFLVIANELYSRIKKINGNEKKQNTQIGDEKTSVGIQARLKQMSRNEILKILGSNMVPKDIFKQFPDEVKQTIHIDQKLMGRKAGPVIKNIDLKIDPGETAAFVRETGAGKSTIIKLISRFYDIEHDKGSVKIDGINVKDFKRNDLRSLIGMVPQDNFTFSGTILENLYYGLPENIPREVNEKLINISEFLGLHDFIEEKPLGYNTQLQEMGSNISVGQRQLICLARVLLTDPKILILDEATSAIDPHTEKIIQTAIDKVRKGRTTIMIAHRLSTIRDADKIFVMEEGKIIEHGSHEELMKQQGRYAKLINIQK